MILHLERHSKQAAWVHSVQLMLLVAGFALLGYAGFILAHAELYQIHESRAFVQRAAHESAILPAPTGQPPQPVSALFRNVQAYRPATGEPVARLEIPSVGLNTVVLEGDDARTLRLGPGHIPGTALPGEEGNIGIAAHRDTFFRCLRHLKPGQFITLDTYNATHTYRVEALTVVPPTQTLVLAPSRQNVLTLVTCYPFYYVGAAPKRFIVRARLVSSSRAAIAS